MRRRIGAACCALALLLTGCAFHSASQNTQPPEGSYGVYFSTADDKRAVAAVDCEYHVLEEGVSPVPTLMGLLLSGPEGAGLKSPFPSGVRLRSWNLADGQLHLDLSEQYSGRAGVDLTIADYCIALTFCQLEEVESVYITVAGEELPFRHTQQLRAEEVILSGAEEEPLYVGVNLWFPRADGDGLGVEFRQVLKTEDNTILDAVTAAWLSGPEYESLVSDVPAGTEIYSAVLENGICTVNLSSAFSAGRPMYQGRAKLLIYSLVNTLGGLEMVEAVQVQVEGEPVIYYGGVRADRPLEPNLSLETGLTKP